VVKNDGCYNFVVGYYSNRGNNNSRSKGGIGILERSGETTEKVMRYGRTAHLSVFSPL
jgi:hypothetical protein